MWKLSWRNLCILWLQKAGTADEMTKNDISWVRNCGAVQFKFEWCVLGTDVIDAGKRNNMSPLFFSVAMRSKDILALLWMFFKFTSTGSWKAVVWEYVQGKCEVHSLGISIWDGQHVVIDTASGSSKILCSPMVHDHQLYPKHSVILHEWVMLWSYVRWCSLTVCWRRAAKFADCYNAIRQGKCRMKYLISFQKHLQVLFQVWDVQFSDLASCSAASRSKYAGIELVYVVL